jgi:hypothetical protein
MDNKNTQTPICLKHENGINLDDDINLRRAYRTIYKGYAGPMPESCYWLDDYLKINYEKQDAIYDEIYKISEMLKEANKMLGDAYKRLSNLMD